MVAYYIRWLEVGIGNVRRLECDVDTALCTYPTTETHTTIFAHIGVLSHNI